MAANFRSEHPRPDHRRDPWLSLNGPWRFAFDPEMIGEQDRWHRPTAGRPKSLEINVPFPWESRLSGVAAPRYQGAAWYEREVTVPAEWTDLRPILHFGAIDWSARVWVNGHLVAEHENGFLPFAVDLGAFVRPGETATLTVRAYDVCDAATLIGKQVRRWYTHTSGLWQSVWLEGRPASHVVDARIEPDISHATARITATLAIARAGDFTLSLSSPDDEFSPEVGRFTLAVGIHEVALVVPIPSARLWSPESPYLYSLKVGLEPAVGSPPDRLTTYFGMREIRRGAPADKPHEYVLLNGEPVYLRGALDQAFHPDGIYTYPSDEDIRRDIAAAKALGLNMLRCHIKINDPRYYYWADRLGVLIMSDLPSPDLDTPRMRRTWEATLRGVVARDFNHPSVFAWVLFNETWGLEYHGTTEGQAWVRDMYYLAKRLDPTRLVEDNSPCLYDHVVTDLNSWHFYLNDYAQVRRHVQRVADETYPGSTFNFVGGEYVQDTAPLINSEYAGISARMGDQDIAWSFKYQTTELRRHSKIGGYVYTELTDIEWEHNGFLNYDRTRKEFGYDFFVPGMTVADLNGPDFVGLDLPPCQTLPPGAELRAPVFVSHYGVPMGGARVRWKVTFSDRLARRKDVSAGELAVIPRRFDVVEAESLRLTLPDENGLATIALWLEDDAGGVRCRNYVNVEVRAQATARQERTPEGWLLRFAPGDFVASSWPNPAVEPGGAKFAALGSGSVEYRVDLPEGLDPSRLSGLRLRFEAGARAGRAKVDWPERAQATDYPQTEERRFPTDLGVSVNGLTLGVASLADDPADARGALSHHHRYDPGSYGFLVDLAADVASLASLRASLARERRLTVRLAVAPDADARGGLALYGETLGCYPLDPTIILEEGVAL